jgi:hypothetical protein
MIPADALHKIRSVKIGYHSRAITGFEFLDKDGARLWKIGRSEWFYWYNWDTVVLEENEVIVGVVARLSGCKSKYSDF